MAIYDCFMFRDELDLLEIRLHELYGVVDKFVISEATYTHSRKPKPLYFDANRDRFAEFADRIVYIVTEEPPRDSEWHREYDQRDAMIPYLLANAQDDDVVLHLDIDEIPNPDKVPHGLNHGEIVGFRMFLCELYLNRLSYGTWSPVGAITIKTLRSMLLSELRIKTYQTHGVRFIPSSGCHISWVGGPDRIRDKAVATVHVEFDDPRMWSNSYLDDIVRNDREMGYGMLGLSGTHENHRFFIANDTSYLPAYIKNNREKFNEWFL